MAAFTLSDWQDKVAQVVAKTPAPGRFAALSAIDHLKKAWGIRDIDPAMAVFRGITADEESATAVFHALKARRYRGASALNPRRHDQKAALVPFCAAIEHALVGMMPLQPTVVLKKPSARSPRIRLRFAAYDVSGQKYVIEPEPPLHGIMSVNGLPHDFAHELQQLATRQRAKKILDHVKRLANERNLLLYSSPRGFPNVSDLKDEFFAQAARRIFRNLGIYLFIIEYRQRQDFVQQALDAFLAMLEYLPSQGQDASE
jgi:hypothetical protein